MTQITSKMRLLGLAAGLLAISSVGAHAANSYYTAGDLVLTFQQDGGPNSIYADLGNTATFRGAATGPDAANAINKININSQLTAAYGASWATATNLYAGVAGVWSTSATSNVLQSGDPARTLYVGASRGGAGTLGVANSTAYDLSSAGNTAMTTGASGITSMLTPFADTAGTNGYNSLAVFATTTGLASAIAAQNPFLSPGIQGTAFGVFGGGVQQVGGTIAAGTRLGSINNVVYALDLYRIEAKNTIAGQVGLNDPLRVGTFEGTIVLDNLGNVSFLDVVPVPEPSTYVMLGLVALGVIAVRRRKVASFA